MQPAGLERREAKKGGEREGEKGPKIGRLEAIREMSTIEKDVFQAEKKIAREGKNRTKENGTVCLCVSG